VESTDIGINGPSAGPGGFATPARLVMAVFFLHAFLLTNWFQRIPDMRTALDVGPADLSIGLLGLSVGVVISLLFAGRLVQRFGPRRMIMIGFTLYAAAFCLPGFAWSIPSLFAALLCVGLVHPVVDVSMNVEADRIERVTGRRIMSTCHGFWSVGLIAGGLIGGAFASYAVAPRWHLAIAAAVSLPLALLIARALPVIPAPPRTTSERQPILALPTWSLLGLCIFGFGLILAENAAFDWAAVFMRQELGTTAFEAGVGYGVFALFMTVGRMLGDRLSATYGPVRLARACGIAALVGFTILVFSTDFLLAVVGLAFAGFGVSVAAPLAVSAAARRGDRPAPINVAALSLIAFGSVLVEPPLVGFVADAAGAIRYGIAAVLPAVVISILLSGELGRRVTPAPEAKLAEAGEGGRAR
jgi:MFS family permease